MFQSKFECKAFHVKISFIHMQILFHLHENKTNFPYERLRTRTHFETEVKHNFEITYSTKILACPKEQSLE